MKSLARSLSLRWSPCETGHPLSGHFENLRSSSNVAMVDEIAVIASPALFLALPSHSLPALLDGIAFIGRLGPVELGAASAFKLVSKMFNVPVMHVTASFVAEDASTMEVVPEIFERE